jgi:hypothetical protein
VNPSEAEEYCAVETCHSAWEVRQRPGGVAGCVGRNCGAEDVAASSAAASSPP